MCDTRGNPLGIAVADKTIYGALAVVACINLSWIAMSRIELVWIGLLGEILHIVVLLLAGFAAYRALSNGYGKKWLIYFYALVQGLVFLKLAWINLRLFNHLAMTTAFPYSDDLLLAWDLAVGFDWLVYFNFFHDRPMLLWIMDLSYTSLTPLSVAAFTALIFLGRVDRAILFIETFFVTALLSMIVGMFFPAKAASEILVTDITLYENFLHKPGIYHMPYMESLRANIGAIVLHPLNLPGLVTFPSFHTASGIILCVAFWRMWAFPFVLAYSIVMIASTPIFGGHYVIDLLAGTALALMVVALLSRSPKHLDVFKNT